MTTNILLTPAQPALVFVSSPLQLVCAISLLKTKKIYNYRIKIFTYKNNATGLRQLKGVLALYTINLACVQFIYLSPFSFLNAINIFANALFYRFILFPLNQTFIFGDFFNTHYHFVRLLFPFRHTYMVDDGFSSFRALSSHLSKLNYLPNLNSLPFKLPFKDLLRVKPFTAYSIYSDYFPESLFAQKLNLLPPFKTNIAIPSILSSTCFFVGTKLSERHAMSLFDELEIMKGIHEYYSSRLIICYYIAKRSTSVHKLRLIEDIGFTVVIPDLPFEIYLHQLSFLPGIVCGFGSSVFCTLHSFFPAISYHVVDISSFLSRPLDKESAKYFKAFIDLCPYLYELNILPSSESSYPLVES